MKKLDRGQEQIARDFQDFLSVEETRPPLQLTRNILTQVTSELSPSPWLLLAKLLFLHIPAGSFSLLACSQFGIGNTSPLTHRFMGLGDFGCFFFCGALFFTVTSAVALLIFSPRELRAIRQLAYSPFFGIGVVSLLTFLALGATLTFATVLAWLLGGVLTGIGFTEAGILIGRSSGRPLA
jgi:hypothetical protein